MNQRVLNKLRKEHNISGHKWSATHRVLKSHRSKMSITGITYILCSSCFCEIWALCVSWITYDHLYYAPCLASLVHWYQQCVTVHHAPKCMSCHKAVAEIIGRAHCFHNNIYIMLILLLRDLSTLCIVDHLWPLILRSLLSLLITLWLIGTSNAYRTLCVQVHELSQSHCGDNREDTLFSQ